LRLLLASAGVTNASIRSALVDLLGEPIAESTALCIPTASYGMRGGAARSAWRFIAGQEPDCPMTGLGWKSVGVLELTAVASLSGDQWVPAVREADVLLVNGGDPLFLHHWMVKSGFAELLPTLSDSVYVGMSAGSMVMTPRIGEDLVEWRPPAGEGDATLGLVDFAIFPHLDHPDLPENTMADAERWAKGMTVPAYAIDDQTAIKVTDNGVEVVTEGHWRLFEREP
jgi:dipeptidase E